MSTARKPLPGSLEALATRWLAAKQLARRSPASDAARRADLAVIAVILADNRGASRGSQSSQLRPSAFPAGSRRPRTPALADALAAYGDDHACADTVPRAIPEC